METKRGDRGKIAIYDLRGRKREGERERGREGHLSEGWGAIIRSNMVSFQAARLVSCFAFKVLGREVIGGRPGPVSCVFPFRWPRDDPSLDLVLFYFILLRWVLCVVGC